MKKIAIIGLMLLLTACDKQESQPITSSQTSNSQLSQKTVMDKAIETISENSEAFKKSTQIADIFALQSAMQKTGIQQDDGIKWQERLAKAKSEQEVKAILQEQINAVTQMKSELQGVKLHSQEVKKIRDDLVNGAEIIANAQNKMMAMNLNDPNIQTHLVPLTNDIAKGGAILFGANDRFFALVQSLGFTSNEEAKQYYENYKGQFEQFKHNTQSQ